MSMTKRFCVEVLAEFGKGEHDEILVLTIPNPVNDTDELIRQIAMSQMHDGRNAATRLLNSYAHLLSASITDHDATQQLLRLRSAYREMLFYGSSEDQQ